MTYDFGCQIYCVGATGFWMSVCGRLATNAQKVTGCGYTRGYRIGELGVLRFFASTAPIQDRPGIPNYLECRFKHHIKDFAYANEIFDIYRRLG